MAGKKIDRKEDRKTRIFLSYSRKDMAFVELLKAELEKTGYQPSLDKTDIAPGEAWQDRLGKLIQDADAVVFCLSPHSAASSICGWEVNEAAKLGKRIIPAVADAVDLSGLPGELTKLNFIFFVDASFDEAFAKLRSALDTNLDWVRLHTRLGELALEWQARNKASSQLLFGRSLRDAEIWSAKRPNDVELPTPLQLQYIAASRSAASGRQRWGLFAALAVTVVSISLFVWGLFNQFEATAQRDSAEKTAQLALNAGETFSVDVVNKLKQTSGVPLTAPQIVLDSTLDMQNNMLVQGVMDLSLKASIVITYIQLSDVHLFQGHTTEAIDYANQAIKHAEDFEKNFAEAEPKDDEEKRLRNNNLINLTSSYQTLGDVQMNSLEDYSSALENFKKQLESAALVPEEVKGKDEKNMSLALAHERIGDTQYHLGHHDEALAAAIRSLDIFKTFVPQASTGETSIPMNPDLDKCNSVSERKLDSEAKINFRFAEISSLDLIGRILNESKEFSKAIPYFCESLMAANEVSAARPDDLSIMHALAGTRKALANNLHLQGGADNDLRASLLYASYMNTAESLSKNNQQNAGLLNDYADAVLLNANFNQHEEVSDYQKKLYKTYVDLVLKQALMNPTDQVFLGRLVTGYDIFRGLGLQMEYSDDVALKAFISSMTQNAEYETMSPEKKIGLTKAALAALSTQ